MILYVFGGLPGTGKTTLSQRLARDDTAAYVRIDTIEHALIDAGYEAIGAEGYRIAYDLAADNLRVGRSVIADSVNPIRATRAAWREVASRCGAKVVEIEVVCSDAAEHESRVAQRAATATSRALTWEDVRTRQYERWDRPHHILDTAGHSVEQSYSRLRHMLQLPCP